MLIDTHKNTDNNSSNNSNNITIGEVSQSRYNVKDYNLLQPTSSINSFGVNNNDVIELHVYNTSKQLLKSTYNLNTWLTTGITTSNTSSLLVPEVGNPQINTSTFALKLNIFKDLSDLGVQLGKYVTVYNIFRNFVGDVNNKGYVQAISNNRKELRINFNSINVVEQLKLAYLNNVVPISKWRDLILNFGENKTFLVVNYSVDLSQENPSILVKLYNPLPTDISTKTECWICEEIGSPVINTVFLTAEENKSFNLLRGPNFNTIYNNNKNSSQFQSWENIIGTSSLSLVGTGSFTMQQLLDKYINNVETNNGVQVNIDYNNFSNFIHFSSIEERIKNFKYKLELIEQYDSSITELLNVTASLNLNTNIKIVRDRKDLVINSFDNYEKFLYYNSGSYDEWGNYSGSTTWPKQNSTYPYINHSVTNSYVESWYTDKIASASYYDKNNSNQLVKLLPSYILEDDLNEEGITFINMVAQYFDLVYIYIRELTTQIQNKDESFERGISKDLIYNVVKSFGFDVDNGFNDDDLWNYTLGTNASGGYYLTNPLNPSESVISASNFPIPKGDVMKEVWKRILNNVVYLHKTKGTERGVRALLNCYGIPDTILRVREYGGPEAPSSSYSGSIYEFNKFNYAAYTTPNSSSITLPWLTTSNSFTASTVEMRVRLTSASVTTGTPEPTNWNILFNRSGSNSSVTGSSRIKVVRLTGIVNTLTSSYFPLFNSKWWNVAIVKGEELLGSQSFTVHFKQQENGRITQEVSFSDSIGSGIFWNYDSASVTPISQSGIEIQEVRYWKTQLTEDILRKHTLHPTSIVSKTGSDPYDDLFYRVTFGSDTKTGSLGNNIQSSHPNNANGYLTGSYTYPNGLSWIPNYETYYSNWPDLGGNRQISNKVRIESSSLNRRLSPDYKSERALFDIYPIDSPKIGVFFSSNDEVNEDISEYYGGINLDDYIGDPAYDNLPNYPLLDRKFYEYLRKYRVGKQNTPNYVRLINFFNKSLFDHIKLMLPERSNKMVGLVIDSPILWRNKISNTKLSISKDTYTGSITITDTASISGSYHTYNANIRAYSQSYCTPAHSASIGISLYDTTSFYTLNYLLSPNSMSNLTSVTNFTASMALNTFYIDVNNNRISLRVPNTIISNDLNYYNSSESIINLPLDNTKIQLQFCSSLSIIYKIDTWDLKQDYIYLTPTGSSSVMFIEGAYSTQMAWSHSYGITGYEIMPCLKYSPQPLIVDIWPSYSFKMKKINIYENALAKAKNNVSSSFLGVSDISDYRPLNLQNCFYIGSRLEGQGFNIPSLETIDGGPVISITQINPNQITIVDDARGGGNIIIN